MATIKIRNRNLDHVETSLTRLQEREVAEHLELRRGTHLPDKGWIDVLLDNSNRAALL